MKNCVCGVNQNRRSEWTDLRTIEIWTLICHGNKSPLVEPDCRGNLVFEIFGLFTVDDSSKGSNLLSIENKVKGPSKRREMTGNDSKNCLPIDTLSSFSRVGWISGLCDEILLNIEEEAIVVVFHLAKLQEVLGGFGTLIHVQINCKIAKRCFQNNRHRIKENESKWKGRN